MTIETRSSNRANPRPAEFVVEEQPTVAGDWRHGAACRDHPDLELWFPVSELEYGPVLLQIEDAKSVCYRCPVIESCLSWAMEAQEGFGIWGGLTAKERANMKRSLGRKSRGVAA